MSPLGNYWNVVDAAEPSKLLMNVSTTNYVIASTEAGGWRRKHPKREFNVVRTDKLEPYKLEEGK
jgi:hypothetical protein